MNSTVYIFGNLSSGYTQYPDDYTKKIFLFIQDKAKAVSQIIVHREGQLMYYTYIRKLEDKQYVGLCVLLNNLMITKFGAIFYLFENAITKMATNGFIIKFDESGNLVPNVSRLYENQEELEFVSQILKAGFNNQESTSQKLPPINFGIKADSISEFSFEDSAEDILRSTYLKGFTVIYKSKNYNSRRLESYKGVLSKISQENERLKDEIIAVQKQNHKILQQKKQIKKVNLLIVVLVGCSLGLFYLNENLGNTQTLLNAANDKIKSKDSVISVMKGRLETMNYNLSFTKKQLGNTLKDNKKLRQTINEIKVISPYIIKDLSFDEYSGYLTIKYYGLEAKYIKITVRITPYMKSSWEYSKNVFWVAGDSTELFYIGDRLEKDIYDFEISFDNKVVAKKRILIS